MPYKIAYGYLVTSINLYILWNKAFFWKENVWIEFVLKFLLPKGPLKNKEISDYYSFWVTEMKHISIFLPQRVTHAGTESFPGQNWK